MNADHDFQIGKNHIVCEDFALSGVSEDGKSSYAIVCDGCSASPDVDIGARILACSAREQLKKIDLMNFDSALHYEEFGSQVIRRADLIFPMFPSLNNLSLDATLLISWVKNDVATTYMFGDGVYFYTHDGKTHATHVEFESGAPAYLSYQLEPKRMKAYESTIIGDKIQTEEFFGSDVAKGWETKLKPFNPIIITHPVMPGDIVAVASDGINSFCQANSDKIDWKDLVNEFIGYKNFEGVFAKRRFSAFKRKCVKDGITHGDDISIASIVI